MVKSYQPITAKGLLHEFARVSKNTLAPNNQKQEDGWGVAWINKKNKWELMRSLKSIWNDTQKFSLVPMTKILVVHSRSATFSSQKGIIAYNEPYVEGNYCFVFNGTIKGAKSPKKIPGTIGSQKIWSLIKKKLKTQGIHKALISVKNDLEKWSDKIIGLNIGIATNKSLIAQCSYTQFPNYYTLHYHNKNIQIISSTPLNSYKFTPFSNNEIKNL